MSRRRHSWFVTFSAKMSADCSDTLPKRASTCYSDSQLADQPFVGRPAYICQNSPWPFSLGFEPGKKRVTGYGFIAYQQTEQLKIILWPNIGAKLTGFYSSSFIYMTAQSLERLNLMILGSSCAHAKLLLWEQFLAFTTPRQAVGLKRSYIGGIGSVPVRTISNWPPVSLFQIWMSETHKSRCTLVP